MKKLLLIFCLTICSSVFAAITVPIVWPFSPASNQANALRVIIDNANRAQDKYLFIFENKPGAGGSIAANYVIHSEKPMILLATTGVFTRPILYPKESHDVEQLEPICVGSIGSPIVLISKKYSSVHDLQNSGGFTLGIVTGGFTEIVGKVLQSKMSGVTLVPYQGTINATQDAVGGHIDVSLEFIKDSMPWVDSLALKPIAITGARSIGRYKSFSTQGIPGTENLVINYYFLTNKRVSEVMLVELNKILVHANTQQNILDIWKADEAEVPTFNLADTRNFWNSQRNFWKKDL